MKTVPLVSAALLSAFWMAAVLSVLPSPTELKSRTSSRLGPTPAAPTIPVAVVLMKSLLDTGSDMLFLFARLFPFPRFWQLETGQAAAHGRLWGHKNYGDMLNEMPVFAEYFGGACPHNIRGS